MKLSKIKKKMELIGYEKKSIYLGMDDNEDYVLHETIEDDLSKPIYKEIEYEDKNVEKIKKINIL